MAEVKHTPGPWIYYADLPSTEPNWHIVTTANKLRVLANVHIEPGNRMDEANARLIAAAPDLFEALPDLTHVIAWLRNGCEVQHAVTELEIYQRRIDAALSKATAQQ